ncbi:MAG: sulfurtransferase [Geobacteraceae bacterium GWC2_58_44]|nr:MAG: sulfurtransferase [Geobacteraceae bacterium GWC2_58_44]HBG05887.1 rhodanese-like domain-containing protein [Geobacter sp.]
MLKRDRFITVAEICLIIIISASAGVAWNWSLLTGAWRGEATQQAQPSAPTGEELPMPIGLMQVKEMHDSKQAVLVDARNAASFAEGHITGAIILPLDQARKNLSFPSSAKVPKDATIIVYCNGFSCHDSMEVGKLLMQAGYASVYVYEGGFPEWRDAGYPVATGGT